MESAPIDSRSTVVILVRYNTYFVYLYAIYIIIFTAIATRNCSPPFCLLIIVTVPTYMLFI